MNKNFAFGLMAVTKLVKQFVCDKGLPKTHDYPQKIDIPMDVLKFPKVDIGELKLPKLPDLIIR